MKSFLTSKRMYERWIRDKLSDADISDQFVHLWKLLAARNCSTYILKNGYMFTITKSMEK